MRAGKLVLRGWKGLDVGIPLAPLTFLAGPNGCGKSAVLEAFALVAHLARRGSLREDLRPWLRGWPDGIFSKFGAGMAGRRSASQFMRPDLRIDLHWQNSSYGLVIQNPKRPEIRQESLTVDGTTHIRTKHADGRAVRTFAAKGSGRPWVTHDPYESALASIGRVPRRRAPKMSMFEFVTRVEVYALDADFLRGTAVDTRPLQYSRKGAGLVSGLLDVRYDAGVWTPLFKALQAVQPDLKNIRVNRKPRGALLEYDDGRTLELDEESDGLVRAIGMFLVRYRRECPKILAFDEPENGYHLSRLMDVVTHLSPSAGPRGRAPDVVLLATHSPEFIRNAILAGPSEVSVTSLWRAKDGRVMAHAWSGMDLRQEDQFDQMVAEAFRGR